MKLKGIQPSMRDHQEAKARDAEESKQPDEAGEVLKHFFGFNVNTSTGIDEAADRALNAVTRKLDKSLSVEFTVNELIAEATDEVNLSNMYMGKGCCCFLPSQRLTCAAPQAGPHISRHHTSALYS